MAKWNILLIIMLCVPFVYGETLIQVSTDNATWTDINSSIFGGSVFEADKDAYVPLLKPGILYFIRAKNDSTSWFYTSQRTKSEDQNMEMAVMLALVGVTLALALFAIFSKNMAFQVGFLLMTFLMIIADFRFASLLITANNPALTGLIHNMDTMYFIGINIFRWLLAFAGITVLWMVFMSLKNWKNRKKKLREEQWMMGFDE